MTDIASPGGIQVYIEDITGALGLIIAKPASTGAPTNVANIEVRQAMLEGDRLVAFVDAAAGKGTALVTGYDFIAGPPATTTLPA